MQRRAATDGAALGTPGKRTLTEQLPASTGVIQAKGPDGAPSGPQGTGANDAQPLDPRGQVINHLLTSFQNIDVEVPAPGAGPGPGAGAATVHVHVKAPYWNNKYVQKVNNEQLPPPDGFDLAARNAQLPALGIDLHSAVAVGKARPEEIADKVKLAIARGLIATPPSSAAVDAGSWASAWTAEIEAWLVRVGIGIDCNGFVYEALQDLVAAGAQPTGKAGGLPGIIDDLPSEGLSRTNASIDEMDALGTKVNAPDDLQVADLMVRKGLDHVRILLQVDRSEPGITKFTTAESTADGRYSPDGRGDKGADSPGPRIHDWCYLPGKELRQRYEGTPDTLDSFVAVEPGDKDVDYVRHLAPAAAASGGGLSKVQRKAAGEAMASADAAAAAGPGAPLPDATRTRMERSFGASFGASFGGVRVHQGDAAPAIGALAYADGEQLHFAPGRYQPGSREGDALIGHELAHVVQQREGRVAAPQGKGAQVVDDPALEAEADRMGEAAAEGRPAGPRAEAAAQATAAPGRTVQRQGGGTGTDTSARSPVKFEDALHNVDDLITRRAAGQPVTDDDIHTAVAALVQCCRTTLPDPHQMQLYLASTASNADKTKIIGQMGDELARMEFMLGGLYNGAPSGVSWRADAGSAALFPGAYLTAAEVDTSLNWCTSFAGYGFGRLGADKSVTNALGSGPKQREHGDVVFPQESWGILRQLIAFRTDQGLAAKVTVDALVDAFLAGPGGALGLLDGPPGAGGRTPFQQYLYNKGLDGLAGMVGSRTIPVSLPAVGDLLILNPGGKAAGKGDEHTAMVDRFSGSVLTTIEGNIGDVGNATGSRRLDLHVPGDLDQIYFITRPAQQIASAHPAMAGTEAYAGVGQVQLQSLQDHNAQIRAVFDKLSGGAPAPHDRPAATPTR